MLSVSTGGFFAQDVAQSATQNARARNSIMEEMWRIVYRFYKKNYT
jgi:hypothetical protein